MSTTYFKIDSTDEGGYPQVECDCVPIMQLISPWKLHNENFCSLEFTLNKKAVLTVCNKRTFSTALNAEKNKIKFRQNTLISRSNLVFSSM